jgi:hypothetical protein
MRLSTLSFSLCLACLVPAAAPAQTARPGAASQPAAQSADIASMTALPAEIRSALGEMSDRGGPFASGCVSLHGEPHSRFVGARVELETAQVTIERGGIAHFVDKRDFRKVDGHWIALPDTSLPRAPMAPPAPLATRN